ncbi:uncharacterized protein N7477_003726 [Penicillium maclennaniae]|uniref:uncharacterized protein n=1 Tax=Penicillium maclennaniae TaxID=1343394 RepID=UPI002541A99F|nr:uncharacterized protein N7477_003726 [Penicillium maclennaniae]KAJ5678093.1 hypothetical protein N7477_003726 [Penicillium maclennaniae]
MSKLVFTPWKTKSQLLEVRSEFYPPPSYDGPDMRAHACATVEAWKLRGNLPHHVEATALLTDAILHDDAQRNSIFSIRATYSAAFCRFVTGLVDTKIHGQRRTMFQRAMDLGLPASFVELRHEATHREPPSLVVLRKASQRSLEWLWDNYWVSVEDLGDFSAIQLDNSESVKKAFRDTLRQFSTESASDTPSKKRKRDHEVSIAAKLVSICDASSEGVRSLPAALLERATLIDSAREPGESLDEKFETWDVVLQKIAESHPSVVVYLAEELVHSLVFNPANESSESAYAEALFLWLLHLLTSPEWESHQSFFPRSYILAACSESPNHWAQLLSDRLREIPSRAAPSKAKLAAQKLSKKGSSQNGNASVSDVDQKLREHGWGPVEAWDSRPLGIASI